MEFTMTRFPLALAASLIAAPAFAMPASICNPMAEAMSGAMELRQMGMKRSTIEAALNDMLTSPDERELTAHMLDAVYAVDVMDSPAKRAAAPAMFSALFLESCLAK
jgi:hypothetical protein